MRKIIYLSGILTVLLMACETPYVTPQADALNGYWEIESVELPDGTTKKFSINMNIDFIEVNNLKGVRTKVAPQLDGGYINSGNVEQFSILIENDSLNLYYETPYDNWKETVIIAKDSTMEVLNKDGKMYRYKKYVPLVIKE